MNSDLLTTKFVLIVLINDVNDLKHDSDSHNSMQLQKEFYIASYMLLVLELDNVSIASYTAI